LVMPSCTRNSMIVVFKRSPPTPGPSATLRGPSGGPIKQLKHAVDI
jgi:hypothetical protein